VKTILLIIVITWTIWYTCQIIHHPSHFHLFHSWRGKKLYESSSSLQNTKWRNIVLDCGYELTKEHSKVFLHPLMWLSRVPCKSLFTFLFYYWPCFRNNLFQLKEKTFDHNYIEPGKQLAPSVWKKLITNASNRWFNKKALRKLHQVRYTSHYSYDASRGLRVLIELVRCMLGGAGRCSRNHYH
jgi:hypothetical protein